MKLNLDSLNKWLTLGANVGVFVGLILVAYEIHQSGQSLKLSASSDGVDNFTQAMQFLVQNEELARLVYRAENSFDELDEFDRWRVLKYLDGYFSMSEQDFLVLDSMRGEDDVLGFKDDWRENMSLPAYRDYWSRSDTRHTPGFRRLINDILLELDGR